MRHLVPFFSSIILWLTQIVYRVSQRSTPPSIRVGQLLSVSVEYLEGFKQSLRGELPGAVVVYYGGRFEGETRIYVENSL